MHRTLWRLTSQVQFLRPSTGPHIDARVSAAKARAVLSSYWADALDGGGASMQPQPASPKAQAGAQVAPCLQQAAPLSLVQQSGVSPRKHRGDGTFSDRGHTWLTSTVIIIKPAAAEVASIFAGTVVMRTTRGFIARGESTFARRRVRGLPCHDD